MPRSFEPVWIRLARSANRAAHQIGLAARFRDDRRGAVALLFALLILPLVGTAGLAVDYARLMAAKRRLDLAADASVLAALSAAVNDINDRRTDNDAFTHGNSEGFSYFVSQASGSAAVDTPWPDVTVFRDPADKTRVLGRITYATKVQSLFPGIFGAKAMTVSGRAESSATIAVFQDIHVLVDVSESMGIGATANDQSILHNKVGCVFGCHILEYDDWQSTYQRGRAAGARMRIDVVRDALVRLIGQMKDSGGGKFRVAVYTFHSQFQELVPLTSNFASAASAAQNLSLASDFGGTNFHYAMSQMRGRIGTVGDGTTASAPKASVIVMTDGVEGNGMRHPHNEKYYTDPNFVYYWPYDGDFGGYVQSINPSICSAYKDAGMRMIAMNTKYIIPTQQYNIKFDYIRDTLAAYVTRNMISCVSSPQDYYDASSPDEINAALGRIFNAITKPIALSR